MMMSITLFPTKKLRFFSIVCLLLHIQAQAVAKCTAAAFVTKTSLQLSRRLTQRSVKEIMQQQHQQQRQCPGVALQMGFLDNISSFLQDRDGDFVKLDKTANAFGPGPVLILYKVPLGIDDDEVFEMIKDGAPNAFNKGVSVKRISTQHDNLLDLPVKEALQAVLSKNKGRSDIGTNKMVAFPEEESGCPVLFFSGFRNEEMMATYEILAYEIYQETGGKFSPACAKAVPNAMDKSLGQVVEEISSDHENSMDKELDAKTNAFLDNNEEEESNSLSGASDASS